MGNIKNWYISEQTQTNIDTEDRGVVVTRRKGEKGE